MLVLLFSIDWMCFLLRGGFGISAGVIEILDIREMLTVLHRR